MSPQAAETQPLLPKEVDLVDDLKVKLESDSSKDDDVFLDFPMRKSAQAMRRVLLKAS
jgi:hypothetical protein